MLREDRKHRVLLPTERSARTRHDTGQAARGSFGVADDSEDVAVFTLEHAQVLWPTLVAAVGDWPDPDTSHDFLSSTAVAALEDALRRNTAVLDLATSAWQQHVTVSLELAFAHADAMVRQSIRNCMIDPGPGVSLSAVMVVGDWMAIAAAGESRVRRLRRHKLEELSYRRPNTRADGVLTGTALGLGEACIPSVRFVWLARGDVILVANRQLTEQHAAAALAGQLDVRQSASTIASQLVSQTDHRDSVHAARAAVIRIHSLLGMQLPAPDPRPAQAAEPREAAGPSAASSGARHRRALLVGGLALLTGAAVMWLRPRPAVMDRPRALAARAATQAPPAPAPAVVPSIDTTTAALPIPTELPELAAISELQRQPSPVSGVAQRERAERRAQDRRAADAARVREDALEAEVATETRRRDSLMSVQAALALEARRRDAAANAARTDSIAAEARLTARRRDSIAAADALIRTAAESAEAVRMAAARRTSGTRLLQSWLNGLVSEVNARPTLAPILAAGPSAFASFVQKRRPDLEQATLTATDVSDSIGTATATWLLRWRSDFGPSSSRRMEARADIVLRDGAWVVREWRITSGAP